MICVPTKNSKHNCSIREGVLSLFQHRRIFSVLVPVFKCKGLDSTTQSNSDQLLMFVVCLESHREDSRIPAHVIHSFTHIHSFISDIVNLQVLYYSEVPPTIGLILCWSYQAEAQQATVIEGLAQGPYMGAKEGFEHATFQTQGTEPTTEPPRSTKISMIRKVGLLPVIESGFRKDHTTESLRLHLLYDVYEAINCPQRTLLALFDVSALDTVDHEILLERLYMLFGFSGTLLFWLKSFLSEYSFCDLWVL